MKIGVFDSGIGGTSVAQAIGRAFPDDTIIFKNDTAHVPYGSRSVEDIKVLCVPIIRQLVDEGCSVIVIACNTVSALLAGYLRETFSVPFVALDPMVKPGAAATATNVIAVCATPATLASARYTFLKETFAQACTVLEPDCSDWSSMIEHDAIDYEKISIRIEEVISQGADVIVLGCTHYHWIEDRITQLAGDKAVVMQPEQAIIRQLQTVLARLP